MAKIDFSDDGIGHYIKDNILRVPVYQRPFAWEISNIQDLFEDIKNSYPEDYFIGTIVVNNKGDYFEIVDGQQRLATISLFFSAVRNLLFRENIKDNAKSLENDFLQKRSYRGEVEQKLKLNNIDNDFYLKRILNNNNIDPVKESHERILNSYKFIDRFVDNWFKNRGIEDIYNLVEFIEKKLRIIIVTVSDEVNAFTVFETLNDRGLALSQTDLIKNYLFNKAEDRLGEAQDKWLRFTGAIEAAENEDEILQYIKYYWSSKNGLTREKQLFKDIKNRTMNKAQSIALLNNLDKNTQLYLAILNPGHSFWKDYSTNCTEYILALKELRLTQNRPLLLAILDRLDKHETEKILKLIVSWSVRNLITGTIGVGTLEKEFSNQARLINEGEIKNAPELRKSIENIIPTDVQFKRAFEIASISKNYIARYYLSEIEKSYRSTSELGPISNPERINLEHILPANPSNLKDDWPEFTEELHKSNFKRIGNLTLLDKKMNSDIGNGNFEDKKNIYEQSEIMITKSLSEFSKWRLEEIEKRQKEFAEKALQIWSLEI